MPAPGDNIKKNNNMEEKSKKPSLPIRLIANIIAWVSIIAAIALASKFFPATAKDIIIVAFQFLILCNAALTRKELQKLREKLEQGNEQSDQPQE